MTFAELYFEAVRQLAGLTVDEFASDGREENPYSFRYVRAACDNLGLPFGKVMLFIEAEGAGCDMDFLVNLRPLDEEIGSRWDVVFAKTTEP